MFANWLLSGVWKTRPKTRRSFLPGVMSMGLRNSSSSSEVETRSSEEVEAVGRRGRLEIVGRSPMRVKERRRFIQMPKMRIEAII